MAASNARRKSSNQFADSPKSSPKGSVKYQKKALFVTANGQPVPKGPVPKGSLLSRISKGPQNGSSISKDVKTFKDYKDNSIPKKQRSLLKNNPLYKLMNNDTKTETHGNKNSKNSNEQSMDIAVELRRLSGLAKSRANTKTPVKSAKTMKNKKMSVFKNASKTLNVNSHSSSGNSRGISASSQQPARSNSGASFSFLKASVPPVVRITNLARGTTTEDVRAVLETSVGGVFDCKCVESGSSVSAEAQFINREDAYRAADMFNQSQADGRTIYASVVKDRTILGHVPSASSGVIGGGVAVPFHDSIAALRGLPSRFARSDDLPRARRI